MASESTFLVSQTDATPNKSNTINKIINNNEPKTLLSGMQIYQGEIEGNKYAQFEELALNGKRLQDAQDFSSALTNYESSLKCGSAPYELVAFVYGNLAR